MKLLAWVPPPELEAKALGPDPGGGFPSLIREMEKYVAKVFVYSGEWEQLDHDIYTWDGCPDHTALLLEIDNRSCWLSEVRAFDLLMGYQGAWRFGSTYTAEGIAALLINRLGGRIIKIE